MPHKILKLDSRDNLIIALTNLASNETVSFNAATYTTAGPIPAKQKFTAHALAPGDPAIMYGTIVGRARQPIPAGGLISTRNLQHDTSKYDVRHPQPAWTPPDVSRWRNSTFLGHHRDNNLVGTRNFWLVIPMVFCENRNVATLRDAFEEELGYAPPKIYRRMVRQLIDQHQLGKSDALSADLESAHDEIPAHRIFPNVDGIRFLTHEGGCGGTRQDAASLCALLADYIHHPNVAGATVLSLGCQNAELRMLQSALEHLDPNQTKPVHYLDQQQSGKESTLMTAAIEATFNGLTHANQSVRQPAALSHLAVALKCGGSDGFSGLSANPAIGHTSDLLVALGASTILAEFPELCGAEQNIIDRCTTDALADRFRQLMQSYNARAHAVGSGFEMNPSPGNIADGLITDAIKSCGAARKSGTAPFTDVLDFTEVLRTPGLNLLCTPGNDVECVTAQVGTGANVLLFTTGLGTPTGNAIAPVIKLSSNSALAEKMPDIIDIDTGSIISGDASIESVGEKVLDLVIETASGKLTRAELLAQNDFIPWKRGVSL
jgi:altronate hydrolase